MKDVLYSHTKNNVTTLQIILTQRVEFHFEGIQVKRIRSPGHVKDNHKNMSLTFISLHDQKKKNNRSLQPAVMKCTSLIVRPVNYMYLAILYKCLFLLNYEFE